VRATVCNSFWLLALSRAARVPLQIADVDASLLAEWSLAELQDAEPTRAARSGVQPGMVVRADEQQLKLLFDQLLGNAWRFSRGRDEVRIEVSAAGAGDALRISVRDHGTGFDPALAAKVFEPFQRLHGTDEGGGHGLGLAIAQRIVERMGGVLAVDAVPGEGCTFHVELPRGSDSAGAVPPAGTPP
jgi:signal transduction histidine kinase